MRLRSLLAIIAVPFCCFGLFGMLEPTKPAAPAKDVFAPNVALAPRVLPGVSLDGSVQLPNQWKLRPAGRAMEAR